jgi:hypothetical protein
MGCESGPFVYLRRKCDKFIKMALEHYTSQHVLLSLDLEKLTYKSVKIDSKYSQEYYCTVATNIDDAAQRANWTQGAIECDAHNAEVLKSLTALYEAYEKAYCVNNPKCRTYIGKSKTRVYPYRDEKIYAGLRNACPPRPINQVNVVKDLLTTYDKCKQEKWLKIEQQEYEANKKFNEATDASKLNEKAVMFLIEHGFKLSTCGWVENDVDTSSYFWNANKSKTAYAVAKEYANENKIELDF